MNGGVKASRNHPAAVKSGAQLARRSNGASPGQRRGDHTERAGRGSIGTRGESAAGRAAAKAKANGKARARDAGTKTPARRPGRPKGSLSLTKERHQTIVALIGRGVFPSVAARTVGVPTSTFKEWLARGRGTHPTRAPSPKLQALARDVDQAFAEARAVAEAKVLRDNPERWLRRAAPSSPDEEGWSEPRGPGPGGGSGLQIDFSRLTDEELLDEVMRITRATVLGEIEEREILGPSCPDRDCPCIYHTPQDADPEEEE